MKHRRAPCICIAAFAAALSCASVAQTRSQISDADTTPPSRWADDAARLDEAIRMRVLSADDPRSRWVAGQLDGTDIASKVSHYGAARSAAPQEKLYLASLALACLEPTLPILPECDAVDRLADWATRDGENGVPTMLLAARASRRGDNDTTIAYLELAAAKPLFNEYTTYGALELWNYVMGFPSDADRAARAELATGYASAQTFPALSLIAAACASNSAFAEARRTACSKAGAAMAERSMSVISRTIGAGISERAAADANAADRARSDRVALQTMLSRCGDDDRNAIAALESRDAAARARAIDALDKHVKDKARLGEIVECERRVSR